MHCSTICLDKALSKQHFGVLQPRWTDRSMLLCWLQEETFEALVEKYLASIPKSDITEPKPLTSLQPLPVEFPPGVIREDVK